MVTWGTSPEHGVEISKSVPDINKGQQMALDDMDVKSGDAMAGLKIQGAFIGSCTNSRLSDLRRVAEILKGQKVAEGVRAICVPGSTQVKKQRIIGRGKSKHPS